jgi:hypothetical protein
LVHWVFNSSCVDFMSSKICYMSAGSFQSHRSDNSIITSIDEILTISNTSSHVYPGTRQ